MSDLLERFASRHPRPLASRRGLLGAIGVGAGLAVTSGASAMSEASLPGGVPERDGALSWNLLATAIDRDGAVSIPPALAALERTVVVVDGWMMSFDDAPRQTSFLLMRFDSHCPFCVPGGAASLIEVRSRDGVERVEGRPASIVGTLRIDAGSPRLIYRLEDARAA
jgi:hypothetical protein